MKTLWFKQVYVKDILAGRKTDTIRPDSNRLPKRGDVVAFAVGPRPAFATARIVSVSVVEQVDQRRGKQLAKIYGKTPSLAKPMLRLRFDQVTPIRAPA